MNPMKSSSIVLSPLLALALSGCSSAPPARPAAARSEFDGTLQQRGEAVFRLQNAVMDELIAAGEPAADRAPVLAAAEARIVENCRDINEAASIRAAGEEPGLLLKLRILDSLTRCEDAALAARDHLRTGPTKLRTSQP